MPDPQDLDRQELVTVPEFIVLDTVVKSPPEADHAQPRQVYVRPVVQSIRYRMAPLAQDRQEAFLSGPVPNSWTFRDSWSVIPLRYKQLTVGVAAVILGGWIGFITPWLTQYLERLLR